MQSVILLYRFLHSLPFESVLARINAKINRFHLIWEKSVSREQTKFTFVSTNVLILTPASKLQKSPSRGGGKHGADAVDENNDLQRSISRSLTFASVSSIDCFLQKDELKDRNYSSFIYVGSEAGSRSPTDVESWLNPACIKPSILDYLSKPMVTSAIAQKWILSVVCFVCLCVSLTSCGSLDKKTQKPTPSARCAENRFYWQKKNP